MIALSGFTQRDGRNDRARMKDRQVIKLPQVNKRERREREGIEKKVEREKGG